MRKWSVVALVSMFLSVFGSSAFAVDPEAWDGTYTSLVTVFTDVFYVALMVVIPATALILAAFWVWRSVKHAASLRRGI